MKVMITMINDDKSVYIRMINIIVILFYTWWYEKE